MAVQISGTVGKRQTGQSDSNKMSLVLDAVRNFLLLVGLWLIYNLVRVTAGDELGYAVAHSTSIQQLQSSIGLPHEASFQALFVEHPGFVQAANIYYMWAHFPVTAIFLVWAWGWHRQEYAAIRNTLIAVTSAGLFLHVVYPLLPPRKLPGFIDTGLTFGPSPYDHGASEAANQLAAMPSLHVGWALLVALSVIAVTGYRFRFLALAHPIVTTFVVVLTANHYWTDAIVAIVLVLTVWYVVRRWERQLAEHRARDQDIHEAPDLFETYALDLRDPDLSDRDLSDRDLSDPVLTSSSRR